MTNVRCVLHLHKIILLLPLSPLLSWQQLSVLRRPGAHGASSLRTGRISPFPAHSHTVSCGPSSSASLRVNLLPAVHARLANSGGECNVAACEQGVCSVCRRPSAPWGPWQSQWTCLMFIVLVTYEYALAYFTKCRNYKQENRSTQSLHLQIFN